LKARAGDREASAEELSAIRDRAQSLRSHAVSQYEVKGHDQV
jgi:D-serine deaminase-like pyridoxal phosphate-dependent protein